MSGRRRGTKRVFTVSAKRPVDKQIIIVNAGGVDNAQTNTTLYTVTFPGTVTGLRWSLTDVNNVTGVTGTIYWAIVVTRESVAASAISFTDGSSMYQPEQNVLAAGAHPIWGGGVSGWVSEGKTKAMRKLQKGDQLHFISKIDASDAVSISTLSGPIQFFIKS